MGLFSKILGTVGKIGGTALGTAIGGPIGGKIGGKLGGLAGGAIGGAVEGGKKKNKLKSSASPTAVLNEISAGGGLLEPISGSSFSAASSITSTPVQTAQVFSPKDEDNKRENLAFALQREMNDLFERQLR